MEYVWGSISQWLTLFKLKLYIFKHKKIWFLEKSRPSKFYTLTILYLSLKIIFKRPPRRLILSKIYVFTCRYFFSIDSIKTISVSFLHLWTLEKCMMNWLHADETNIHNGPRTLRKHKVSYCYSKSFKNSQTAINKSLLFKPNLAYEEGLTCDRSLERRHGIFVFVDILIIC